MVGPNQVRRVSVRSSRCQVRPAEALRIGSISDCAWKGFGRYAAHPDCSAASRVVSLSLPVMNMTGNEMPCSLSRRLNSIPEPSFRLMSRTIQKALSRSARSRNDSTESNTAALKPWCLSRRLIPLSMLGSSSTTMTDFRFGKMKDLHAKQIRRRRSLVGTDPKLLC